GIWLQQCVPLCPVLTPLLCVCCRVCLCVRLFQPTPCSSATPTSAPSPCLSSPMCPRKRCKSSSPKRNSPFETRRRDRPSERHDCSPPGQKLRQVEVNSACTVGDT